MTATRNAGLRSEGPLVNPSVSFRDLVSVERLMTQACQPGRMRSYCDLGTKLPEAALIWNHG